MEIVYFEIEQIDLNLVTAATLWIFGSMTLKERFFNEFCQTETIKTANYDITGTIKNSKIDRQTVVICDCF